MRLTLAASAAAIALSLTALPASAAAPPIVTQAQVDHAREICAQHKREVEQLEAKGASDAVLSKQRLAWEDSCEQASDLMNAIGMN